VPSNIATFRCVAATVHDIDPIPVFVVAEGRPEAQELESPLAGTPFQLIMPVRDSRLDNSSERDPSGKEDKSPVSETRHQPESIEEAKMASIFSRYHKRIRLCVHGSPEEALSRVTLFCERPVMSVVG
jgi:hypothetical protein